VRVGPAGVVWESDLPGDARVRCTGRAAGSFLAIDAVDEEVERRRRRLAPFAWTHLHQVHGSTVVVVEGPGGNSGVDADAAVSAHGQVVLSVVTADCAPLALSSPEGVIGVVHAGWRGLAAGVVEGAVAAMRRLGATRVVGALGPCIGPECYQFGAQPLTALVERYGAQLEARTSDGAPALDLRAGVRAALASEEAELAATAPHCTACSSELWSWRARQDAGRQATVVWRTK
jgi:YfiH family protein